MAQQKFMLIYRHNDNAATLITMTPEEMQTTMKKWDAWKQKFKDNVLDMGDGLKPSGRVLKAGVVTDGPYVEGKEVLGGYSIVGADSYERAVEVARECPILNVPSYSIEIRELAGY